MLELAATQGDADAAGSRVAQRQDDAYARAAEEIEQSAMHKGLWARAFADAEGNEQKQKAIYVRYRAEQIAKEAP